MAFFGLIPIMPPAEAQEVQIALQIKSGETLIPCSPQEKLMGNRCTLS